MQSTRRWRVWQSCGLSVLHVRPENSNVGRSVTVSSSPNTIAAAPRDVTKLAKKTGTA
jgi:hypothetical protein